MTLSITIKMPHSALQHLAFGVGTLSSVMLSDAFCYEVCYYSDVFMLNATMLFILILSVLMLSVFMLMSLC